MNDFDLWYKLVNIPNKLKINILNKFKNTENIWYHVVNAKWSYLENNKKLKDRFIKSLDTTKIENLKSTLKNKSIKTITYLDDNYPKKLKNLEDAPFMLFYKGNISMLNNKYNISIVGSRKSTYYGESITRIISKELSKNNINIISGMAKGIDGCAHEVCINNNGYTCAVLGCGVDIIYPRKNHNLYNKIEKKGCLISEFLPGTKPYFYNFPIRNRIISSLSDLLIIVEASLKSGSLITANYALEQGKDILAVPGSVFSNESKGTNKLIQEGAHVFTSISDIFQLIGFKPEIKKVDNNVIIDNVMKNSLENKIYSIIKDTPIHIDDVIRHTNIDIKHLYELLFEMQLSEKIICLTGNYYVRVNNNI